MKKNATFRKKHIRKNSLWWSFGICLILAVTTLSLYWQTHSHKFIHYDDYAYITENPNVRDGFSWQGIKWAFTESYEAAWFPLTWFSHMLDCELFGISPAGHHFTNVSIHIAQVLDGRILGQRHRGGDFCFASFTRRVGRMGCGTQGRIVRTVLDINYLGLRLVCKAKQHSEVFAGIGGFCLWIALKADDCYAAICAAVA